MHDTISLFLGLIHMHVRTKDALTFIKYVMWWSTASSSFLFCFLGVFIWCSQSKVDLDLPSRHKCSGPHVGWGKVMWSTHKMSLQHITYTGLSHMEQNLPRYSNSTANCHTTRMRLLIITNKCLHVKFASNLPVGYDLWIFWCIDAKADCSYWAR